MKTSNEGFQQCYNAQVAVDSDHQRWWRPRDGPTARAGCRRDAVSERSTRSRRRCWPTPGIATSGTWWTCLTRVGYRRGERVSPSGDESHVGETGDARAGGVCGTVGEAPHWIKHVLGFRRFSLRGLATAGGEWDLVCLALNVKRLQRWGRETRGMKPATAAQRCESWPLDFADRFASRRESSSADRRSRPDAVRQVVGRSLSSANLLRRRLLGPLSLQSGSLPSRSIRRPALLRRCLQEEAPTQ